MMMEIQSSIDGNPYREIEDCITQAEEEINLTLRALTTNKNDKDPTIVNDDKRNDEREEESNVAILQRPAPIHFKSDQQQQQNRSSTTTRNQSSISDHRRPIVRPRYLRYKGAYRRRGHQESSSAEELAFGEDEDENEDSDDDETGSVFSYEDLNVLLLSPCSSTASERLKRRTSLEKFKPTLEQQHHRRRQLSKNARQQQYPGVGGNGNGGGGWKYLASPRLIHSMHALNNVVSSTSTTSSARFVVEEDNSISSSTTTSSSSPSSSACSTLSTGGAPGTDRLSFVRSTSNNIQKRPATTFQQQQRGGGRNSESAFFISSTVNKEEKTTTTTKTPSNLSTANRFQSDRNLRSTREEDDVGRRGEGGGISTTNNKSAVNFSTTKASMSSSAFELLDLTNSDSVMRWTSQILAELDSIADCPPEIIATSATGAAKPRRTNETERRSDKDKDKKDEDEEDDVERGRKRDSFIVPAEAKRKLEEACTELRELNVRGGGGGNGDGGMSKTNKQDASCNRMQTSTTLIGGSNQEDRRNPTTLEERTSTVNISHTWPLEQAKTSSSTSSSLPPTAGQQVQQQQHTSTTAASPLVLSSLSSSSSSTSSSKKSIELCPTSIVAENRLYYSTADPEDVQYAGSGDSIRTTTNICPYSATQDPTTKASSQHSSEMNNGRRETTSSTSMIQSASSSASSSSAVGGQDRAGKRWSIRTGGDEGQQLANRRDTNDNQTSSSTTIVMTNYVSPDPRHAPTSNLNNLSYADSQEQQEYRNRNSYSTHQHQQQQRPSNLQSPNETWRHQGYLHPSTISPAATATSSTTGNLGVLGGGGNGKSVRGVVESLIRQAETHLGSKSSSSTTLDYANANINNNEPSMAEQPVKWRTTAGGGGTAAATNRPSSDWNSSGGGLTEKMAMEKKTLSMTEQQNPSSSSSSLWHRSSRTGDFVELFDACTQTTPVSLSRSSSFTWMSEMDQRPNSASLCCPDGHHHLHAYEHEYETGDDDEDDDDGVVSSRMDDERSLTPITDRLPDANANRITGESVLDKSLSLSGISNSSSSSADFNEYLMTTMENSKVQQELQQRSMMEKEKKAATVMGVSGVNSAIQRRNSGRSGNVETAAATSAVAAKKQPVIQDACGEETWPLTNNSITTLPTGEPLLTESLRLLLETVNGTTTNGGGGGETAQLTAGAAASSTRREDKFDQPTLGIGSLSSGRDLSRRLIASSTAQQQQQIRGRPLSSATANKTTTEGARRIGSSSSSSAASTQQQHVHLNYDGRKCLGNVAPRLEKESDIEESIYDNVPRAALAMAKRGGGGGGAGTGTATGGANYVPFSTTSSNNSNGAHNGSKRIMDITGGSPLLRRNRRPVMSSTAATPDSPLEHSLLVNDKKTSNMQRDVSVASGLLADSESSPICAERGFALLDGFRSDMVATPDSVKSLASSDGGLGGGCIGGNGANVCSSQPAPEFQYKSARDYMMDREAAAATAYSRSSHHHHPHRSNEITSSSSSSCSSSSPAMGGGGGGFVVPKESVLRGEATRFLSPPSPNPNSKLATGGGESSSSTGTTIESGGGGSKLSLLAATGIQYEPRAALANSLPALDRLLDHHHHHHHLHLGTASTVAAASSGGPRSIMLASSIGQSGSPSGVVMVKKEASNSLELVADSETAETSGAVFSSRKENAEADARQCCFWLKAAGFPQYASMYEDGQFPIDIEAAQKDHEFLDSDSLQALFRRLRTLNRCALMQLGAGPFHKRVLPSTAKADRDSEDEEDEIALSQKWRFVRKSRTWSRIVNEFGGNNDGIQNGQCQLTPTDGSLSSPPQTTISSSITPGPSQMTTTTDELDSESMENSLSIGGGGGRSKSSNVHILEHRQHRGMVVDESPSPVFVKLRTTSLRQRANDEEENEENDPTSKAADSQKTDRKADQRLRRSQSERLRDKAKALVRRMELMKNGRLRRRSPSLRRNGTEGPEISSPVLIQHFSASPAHMRMFNKDIPTTSTTATAAASRSLQANSSSSPHQQAMAQSTATKFGSDERRRGRIFSADLNAPDDATLHHRGGGGSGGGSSLDRDRVQDHRNSDNVLYQGIVPAAAGQFRSSMQGGSNRTTYAPQQLHVGYDRNGKRQYPESDSSPETQAKIGGGGGGSSSLRVQVDVGNSSAIAPPQVSQSSFDSSDADHSPQCWERRDSGVGSSLSRSPSAPARPRVRWHSFQRRHGPSASTIRSGDSSSNSTTIVDHLTAPQMIAVQKYALLKLTALMEKYSPSYKSSGWSWGVQKLLRRMKASETKVDKERQVFGVPFSVVAQRTGQPLPQCILHALRYLRKQAVDNVGLFRKSGVRSRIHKLRQLCETSTDLPVFESQQAYDVADMVKQYFRELPEPLLTSKLSETFIAIHLNVPEHLRMEAMQKLVLLLPDEHREVLMSLLSFLNDVASHSDRNQMSAQNLAVCFAPTLFQMSGRNAAISPTRRHKTITSASGLPNEKELMENRAAQICLASMITNCKKLFTVPQDILMKCTHTVTDLHEPSNLSELGYPYGNYSTYLAGCIEALMKEHRERWRGWVTEGCIDGVEITSKKANDEYPLKLWRCWVDVEAPPRELLHRILRERDAWDDDIIKWRVVRKLTDNCEVFQFVVNDMPPHPTRDYCVVRQWQSDIHELRGGCVLVQTSVNIPDAPMLGGVRGVCLASRYLIEPSGGGKSRITHVDRIETRGRSKLWYNKIFGYMIATQLARLRDSFKQQMAEGPETKL